MKKGVNDSSEMINLASYTEETDSCEIQLSVMKMIQRSMGWNALWAGGNKTGWCLQSHHGGTVLFCLCLKFSHQTWALANPWRGQHSIYILPDRIQNSKCTFHLHEASSRLPDCCYQANSVCAGGARGSHFRPSPAGSLKASFLHKHFKFTIWLNSSWMENKKMVVTTMRLGPSKCTEPNI